MEGYTLALDFPINKQTLALMERLDRITVEHGGRFYLAKDSRMSRATFQQSEPRQQDFVSFREASTATNAFASEQAVRLGL